MSAYHALMIFEDHAGSYDPNVRPAEARMLELATSVLGGPKHGSGSSAAVRAQNRKRCATPADCSRHLQAGEKPCDTCQAKRN